MKKVLTIAGSDTCGGAGIQADLKTMSALGVYGMSAITAITVQNTMGVFDVMDVNKEIVEKQIKCIYDDIEVSAVKIGMVSSSEIIDVIIKSLKSCRAKNVVVDPVMVSKSGYFLLKEEAVNELKKLVLMADVVTPNIPEAEVLSGIKINTEEDMKKAAIIIYKLGAKGILVKGGHKLKDANDIFYNGRDFITLKGQRINTKNTHGTGCTLSSAIASYLAKGFDMDKSLYLAKTYINDAIKNSFPIGKGVGPVGHFVELYKKAGVKYE